ncbi:YqhA family protein [Micropruina sp.]|uniref:YqhA family protein n=1 Tax=Micropruina sp. TaxID=2737536 RepID=UPI002609DCD5|nr:YqhA family protein [Micropruina sp.]
MPETSPSTRPKRQKEGFSLTRFVVLIPALGMLVGAITLTAVGAVEVYQTIAMAFDAHPETQTFVIAFVEIADVFLLAVVLYIIAIGLYELFIGDLPGLPEWLVFHSLDDLKSQLIGVVVVVLGVFFLGRALHGETPLNLLYLGGGIAAVTAALSLFLRAKH